MTDSERQQILKMIDDGKISAEQGLILMQALDEAPEDEADLTDLPADELIPAVGQPQIAANPAGPKTDPEFDRKVNRFRSLWTIPLWLGVAITVMGAYWMYAALQVSGLGFWFFFAWLPFLFGVLLSGLAFSSRTSRWIYINVKQKPGQSPQRIVLIFPLSLVSWVLQFVKSSVPDGDRGPVNEIMDALFASTLSSEPLMVDVDDEDGQHVQVYIG
ncbi:MAG: hypothetical protein NTW32_00575 [Chloroflexi bacterium]|nr:hypothetical protein [Chloroflexota bacterium]